MKHSTEWKRTERTISRFFGAERNPLSGENSRHKTGSDSLHPRLYIEAKRSARLNKALNKLIEDTILCAKKEKKVPVIAFKVHNHKGFLLLIQSQDLEIIAREAKHGKARSAG